MKLLDRILMRKPGEKRYWIDAEKVWHSYGDCPSVQGKTKMVGRRVCIKYDLCTDCRNRHDAETHKNATDFDENLESYVKELSDKVSKLELPEEEKVTAFNYGLAHILLMRYALHFVDSAGQALRDKVGE